MAMTWRESRCGGGRDEFDEEPSVLIRELTLFNSRKWNYDCTLNRTIT